MKLFVKLALTSIALAGALELFWLQSRSVQLVDADRPAAVVAPARAWKVRPSLAKHHSGGVSQNNPKIARVSPDDPRVLPVGFAEHFPDTTGSISRWSDFRPASLTVAPYADLPLTFTRVALREDRGKVVWIGRNAALPGASYVSVATANGYDGILIVPGASQFSFHVHGGALVVQEAAPGEETCFGQPIAALKSSGAAGGGLAYAVRSGLERAGKLAGPADPIVTSSANVDVLFLYDAAALSYASAQYSDPVGYIEGNCAALIESCNLVLQQSGVTQFSWRSLGAIQCPTYKRTGVLFDDLTQLSPGGQVGDWVAARRYEYSADQIMLLTGGNTDAFGWANLAASGRPIDGPHAISVMRNDGSYRMMAHELAHNFGCRHERADSGGTGVAAPLGDGLWCYGWRWTDPADPANPAAAPTTSGTIMAYADYIVPYYSNPNITLQITSSLEDRSGNRDLGSMTIGSSETNPDAAYNARILNDNASSLVNVSPELAMPVVVQQPAGAALVAGSGLTLSVAATGGGLFYQWLKNGAPIAGATAATFTLSAVSGSDAGDYSVQVQNRMGTTTSNAATVTVSGNVTTPPPGGGSTGGGGGGGGSPSEFFLGSLLLVTVARFRRFARRGGVDSPLTSRLCSIGQRTAASCGQAPDHLQSSGSLRGSAIIS